MVPDAEVLSVVVEILSALKLGDFEIKLSHRRLLDAMLQVAGECAGVFNKITKWPGLWCLLVVKVFSTGAGPSCFIECPGLQRLATWQGFCFSHGSARRCPSAEVLDYMQRH